MNSQYHLYTLIIGLFLSLYSSAQENPTSSVAIHYQTLTTSYNQQMSHKNYKGAWDSAKKLLHLDPSDTIAYLRLAICYQALNKNDPKLMRDYSAMAAQANDYDIELKALADALIFSVDTEKH